MSKKPRVVDDRIDRLIEVSRANGDYDDFSCWPYQDEPGEITEEWYLARLNKSQVNNCGIIFRDQFCRDGR